MTNSSEAARPAWVKTEQVTVVYAHAKFILLATAVTSVLMAGVLWRRVGRPSL
jgi:hypothetical protein